MSYGAHHLPYLRDRIDYRRERARARREHPKPCDCPYCMTAARAAELLARRVEAERERGGEAPF